MTGYDESLDALLGKIESLALKLAAEQGVHGITVTRWRWDEPDITLTWLDRDTNKSLYVRVVPTANLPGRVIIEVNAWRDLDYCDGRRRKRIWNRREIAEVQQDTYDLEKSLRDGIAVARDWKEADLSQVAYVA